MSKTWTKEEANKAKAYIPKTILYAHVNSDYQDIEIPTSDVLDYGNQFHKWENKVATDLAVLSCRYKVSGKWVGDKEFLNATGFKPCKQRDSRVELHKAIVNAVVEFENTPMKGFKFIGVWNDCDSMPVIQDPRGFSVAISLDAYFEIIWKSGHTDMSNIDMHYVFFDNCWTLTPVDSAISKSAITEAECRRILDESKKKVKSSDFTLEVGKLYDFKQTKASEIAKRWIYCGTYERYSPTVLNNFFAGPWYRAAPYMLERCKKYDPKWLEAVKDRLVEVEHGSQVSSDDRGSNVPWLQEGYAECVEKVKASKKVVHIFYDVGDANYKYFDGYVKDPYKFLALTPLNKETYQWQNRCKLVSGTGKSGCLGLSSDQRLTITNEVYVKKWNSHKSVITMAIDPEKICKLVKERLENKKKKVEEWWEKIFPVQKPASIVEWQRLLQNNGYKEER